MSGREGRRDELLVDLETGEDQGSLCELLDRLLHTGVVIRGDIVLSVADLDLVYVGVHVLAASMQTIERSIRNAGKAPEDIEPRPSRSDRTPAVGSGAGPVFATGGSR